MNFKVFPAAIAASGLVTGMIADLQMRNYVGRLDAMEAVAYKVLQIGEGASILLSWVIVVVSAAASVHFSRSEWRIGRSAYFFLSGFSMFLSGLSNLLALGIVDAMRGGYLAALVAIIYGVMVPIGVVSGMFAAARSLDAYGTRNKWFLGFIPLANLILIFAKPTDREPTRTLGVVKAIALVVSGFILVGAGRAIQREITVSVEKGAASAQNDQEIQKKSMQYEVQSNGVESFLKKVASGIPVNQRIDNITTIKGAQVNGNTIRYIYEVSSQSANFSPIWRHIMMSRWCPSTDFKPIYEIGGTVQWQYVDGSGKELAILSANPSLCDEWSKALDADMIVVSQSIKPQTKVDEITTLASASYANKTFYYNYVISISVPDGAWSDSIRETWCKNPSMKWIFEVGLSIRGVYTTPSGAPIATVVVDRKTCGST